MLRRILAGGALALAFLSGAAQAALPIEHWTTSSGARVYFVRADTIPMLDVSLGFDAGARYDPADRLGLASLTNDLLARGAGGINEAAIDEGFAKIGAERGGGASDDRASLSLRTLSREPELSQAVSLLARIVSAPEFPQDVLDREKARSVQALREAETKPETIARRTFAKLLYGTHPYGREASADTVATLARDDLVRFYRGFYDAPRAVVAMIGAITRERAEAIAEQLTTGLPSGAERPPMPDVAPLTASSSRRIANPASQSHILVGAPAIARGDPDYFPLLVGNYVLGGGGFVSRLYNEVREKRGLAYSIYSYFSPQLQPGPFTIGLQTRKAQTDQALEVVRKTLETFVEGGPTEAEVEAAKSNLVGGFALRIDSNRKILDNLAMIGFYRLPLDYLDHWTDRVAAVSRDQIGDAFARHVHPAVMATVVVGDGDQP
ncbi:MAG: M16 family metallopeptidase [Gammaproteobacteria bacterium]